MNNNIIPLINLGISCFFILSLRGLTFPHNAYRSNLLGITGISITLLLALLSCSHLFIALSAILIGTLIGILIALKIKMTELPQTVAAFNGLGGLSAFLIACCAAWEANTDILDTPISAIIGIFTFSGSFIAFAKLQGLIKNNFNNISNKLNIIIFISILIIFTIYALHTNIIYFYILSCLAFFLGISITLRIGGADGLCSLRE